MADEGPHATSSDFEGATEPAPEYAWPGTPGEWAALWNSRTEDERQKIVNAIIEDASARHQRTMQGIPSTFEELQTRYRIVASEAHAELAGKIKDALVELSGEVGDGDLHVLEQVAQKLTPLLEEN